jgi:hypothetical protein
MGRHGLPIFQAAELEEEDLLAGDTPRDPGSTQGSRDPKGPLNEHLQLFHYNCILLYLAIMAAGVDIP